MWDTHLFVVWWHVKIEKTSQELEEKQKDIEVEIAALKRSVDDIVASRTKLVTVFIRISAHLE